MSEYISSSINGMFERIRIENCRIIPQKLKYWYISVLFHVIIWDSFIKMHAYFPVCFFYEADTTKALSAQQLLATKYSIPEVKYNCFKLNLIHKIKRREETSHVGS